MAEQSIGQLAKAFRDRIRKDWDAVIAISGEERVGKSAFAIQLGMLIDSNFDLVKNISYIPDEKEIREQFYSLGQYQVLQIDEAIRALYKLRFFDKIQQTITEMYATEGFHNKVTILCIPRFSDLTGAFRKYRVKIHIHVIARGLAIVYQRDDDKDIADPWHTKENLKLKEKLLKCPINERKLVDIMEIETKTINYLGHCSFPDLDPKIKERYNQLKEDSRKKLDVKSKKKTYAATEKYRQAVTNLLRNSKTIDPKFSDRKYGAITGLHFTQVAKMLREEEQYVDVDL